ncbi:heme exporter protein D [Roseovarius nanhaiticus]|uniref:Heme exporter protein D n=1 Tax=Roseovarius nanhaiticus TaxID=573024 RepID=A0A1N7F8I0_9RHOB|nr:heme exporter protein CcmD [Roseovarius nanhaiticus]SEK59451.1 heme exporter protein D [Roseovarius nanhaiticus]SIR96657.1 heme exporter protein D [Roseovarius nanhaiticus]
MPELGKYAFAVLTSYGATLALLGVLGALSALRARRVRQQLDTLERRLRGNG